MIRAKLSLIATFLSRMDLTSHPTNNNACLLQIFQEYDNCEMLFITRNKCFRACVFHGYL